MSLPRFPALLGALGLWALAAGSAAAQAAAPAGGAGDFLASPMGQTLPMLLIFGAGFYFLILRPQSQRAKQHQAMIGGLKRGDTVVLASGMIGKVTRVEDAEVMLEIAAGVNARVVKAMISEVRTRGEPAKASAPAKAQSARGGKNSKSAPAAAEPAPSEETDDADQAEAS